jgi:hypothetical protein
MNCSTFGHELRLLHGHQKPADDHAICWCMFGRVDDADGFQGSLEVASKNVRPERAIRHTSPAKRLGYAW